MSKTNMLKTLVSRNLKGDRVGIYSVCSANRYVLEAAMLTAKENESILLIEATCNQVNQDGGYTGMTPIDFVDYVADIAKQMAFNMSNIILGGDHLGPNPWKHLPAEEAMKKAINMVKNYVSSGFTKIHLDASMSCSDDPTPLNPNVIAERAALMCQAAESITLTKKPCYIIGTEVPVPGGAQEDLDELAVTKIDDLNQTINTHAELFKSLNIESALERVLGVVVQPGVEFDHASVIEYQPSKATELKNAIHQYDNIVFEAHSTDYQTEAGLTSLVQDHFAILKVGPGLSFAMREAVFSLSHIEDAWIEMEKRSNIRDVLENVMNTKPQYWTGYYHGIKEELEFARRFSFSDRIRYYWSDNEVEKSLATLIKNLTEKPAPLPLISQYFPSIYHDMRDNQCQLTPRDLLHRYIGIELGKYARACNQFGTER
ncbi:MAG: D-tagatose-bisphosphate aldolase, class II, non-catalytic subunit [Marinomonas sp.]